MPPAVNPDQLLPPSTLDQKEGMISISHPAELRIAVLVPCRNEETTVADVVAGFQASLPGCTVYVYDNDSADDTA